MEKQFKPYPDGGSLHAVASKKSVNGKDYFGEIAINLNDKTNVRTTPEGLTIVKLSGWKKVSKNNGKTYLSLSVDRYVPKEAQQDQGQPTNRFQKPAADEFDDSDIPF